MISTMIQKTYTRTAMNTQPIVFFLFLLVASSFASASETPGLNLNEDGFVLHGYDPLSYFDGQPALGEDSITASHGGMSFKFSSEENKDRFMSSPEKYIPAFGGFCAFGVRMGSKFDIDPEVYEIRDGRLYVLLNRSTEDMWLEDFSRNIEIANRLWPSIKDIAPDKL